MNSKNPATDSQPNSDQDLDEAKSYLQKLYRHRPRSRQEAVTRLQGQGYCQETIDKVLQWAEGLDLIDDEKFARLWIEDRLQNKPKGRSGIYKELLDKAVPRDVARQALDDKFEEVNQGELCRQLAQERLNRYQGEEKRAQYRKVSNFLSRRGFSKSLIHPILRELIFNDE